MAKSKTRKLMRQLVGWLIVAALVGVPGAYFYTREPEIEVTAMGLVRGRIEQTIAAFSSGTVEAERTAMVAAESFGRVVAIPAQEGNRVNTGDILVVLDGAQQELQVTQAETQLLQARHVVELLKQQYENDLTRIATVRRTRDIAEQEFAKDKTLYEEGDVGSESMVHLSEVNYNQIDDTYINLNNLLGLYPLRIQEAEMGIKSIEIMIEQARIARDWTLVRAPFDGLVASILVKIGESVGSGFGGGASDGMLGAGLGGTGGGGGLGLGGGGMSMASPMAVVHLVDDSDLYVKAPFDEANYGLIQVGQSVRITIDAYPDEDFPGRVAAIAPIVTRNLDRSRTFDVEVLIEAGKEKFVTGMSADVVVVTEIKEDVLAVPTEALIREEEGYVIEDGRAVRRSVEIGIGNWMTREVLSGLREGEQLITSIGVRELRDGIKVRVVDSLEDR